MVRRRKKAIILWTVFFDSSRSRSEGRKLPKSLCVRNPTVEELEEAVKQLGFEYEVAKDKKYPRIWYLDIPQGYVKIYRDPNTHIPRTKLLRMIAEKLREVRAARARQREAG